MSTFGPYDPEAVLAYWYPEEVGVILFSYERDVFLFLELDSSSFSLLDFLDDSDSFSLSFSSSLSSIVLLSSSDELSLSVSDSFSICCS